MIHVPPTSRYWIIAAIICTAAACLVQSDAAAQPPGFSTPNNEVGLSVNDSRAYQGYSLVAPMNSTTTYLIDMEGRVVKRWDSDCTPAMSAYLLENGHLLRPGAHRGGAIGGAGAGGRVQEFSWEGELLWDYSLATDRNRPHHDICPMPNGNVLMIVWDKKTRDEAVAAGRIPGTVRNEFLPDCILEVQPTGKTTGKIVWEWHAWDHLIQEIDEDKPNYGEVSDHPELIDINFGTNVMADMLKDPAQLAKLRSLGYIGGAAPGPKDRADGRGPGRGGPGPGRGPGMSPDWMHTNSVAYNPELDQIMLSIHEFSEVWIIDHSTTTAEAASHGGGRYGKGGDLLYRWGNPRAYRNGTNGDQRLFAQHCAHWIPKGLPGEGHMLVFNNGNGRPDGMYSTVDEVILPIDEDGNYVREEYLAFGPDRAAWSYSAAVKQSLFSMTISGAQRLPNGNTFICSGNSSLIFEVTPEKETVWKYLAPGAGPGGPGGPFGPGGIRQGEILPTFLQSILQMTDEQKDELKRLQEQVDTERDALLTKEQRKRFANPMSLFGFGMPPGQRDANNRRNGGNPPRGRRGPFGFKPPRPGEVIPSMFHQALDLSTGQSTKLEELQRRVNAQLDEILTRDQKSQLDQMQRAFAGGPGAGPPGFRGPPGSGPPPAFGPPPGFGPPGFGPPSGTGNTNGNNRGKRPDNATVPDARGAGPGPGGPDRRRGPGGLFTCHRYGPDYPGLAGKGLTPGEKLEDLLGKRDGRGSAVEPQGQ